MRGFRLAMAASAVLIASCGGGGGDGPGPAPSPTPTPPPPPSGGLPPPSSAPALKTILATKYGVMDFPVGAAIEPESTSNADAPVLQKHFSSITAENAMKPDTVWPNEAGTAGPTAMPAPEPNLAPGDELVAFAIDNGMQVRGHTLLWHRTAPDWFFAGDRSDPANYRVTVQQRLRDYIFAVIQAWPDIYAWDVVNEVASDTPFDPNPYRTNSPWYEAYGVGNADPTEYVRDAFLFATQARDQLGLTSADMKLMINDYNTELPGKRDNLLRIIEDIRNAGTAADINGVGHQFHLQVGADVSQVVAALEAVEDIDPMFVNHVTELDVSIYQDPANCFSQLMVPPCLADFGASPPASALSQQATLYRALFDAFDRESVTSVTFWGVADNHTWLNFFPVARTNRPLLFDTSRDPKAAFWAVVDPAFVIP